MSGKNTELSDVGVLSYEYEQAQTFAVKIGDVVAGARERRADRQAQLELARRIRALSDLLDPLAARPEDAGAALTVPVGLAQRLREHRRDLPAQLPELARHLGEGEVLAESEIETLELIRALSEREASIVFRRMVRR